MLNSWTGSSTRGLWSSEARWTNDVLLVVDRESNAAVTARFVPDPWIKNGMLTITGIRPWTILLEGRLGTARRPPPDSPEP